MLHEHDKQQLSSSSEVKKHKASSTTKAKQHETTRTSTSTKAHVVFYTANLPPGQHHETSSTHVETGKGTTTEQRKTTLQHSATLQHPTTRHHQTTPQHKTILQQKTTKRVSPADCDCGEFASPCPCSTSKFDPIPTPRQRQSETSGMKHTHPLPMIPMEGTSIKSIASTTTAESVTTTGAADRGQTSGGVIPQIAEHPKSTMIAIVVPVVLLSCVFIALAIWCYFRGGRTRAKVKSWFKWRICCSSRRKHTPPDIIGTTRNAGYQDPTQPQPHAIRGFDKYFDDSVNDWVLKSNRTVGLPYENTIPGPAPIRVSTNPITRNSAPRMQRYGEENPYVMNGIPLY